MRDSRGQQEDLALADGDVLDLAVVHDAEGDVALDLVEELLAVLDVEVLPTVGAADDHDEELAVAPHHGVAHRGLEQMAVLVDPCLEVLG